MGVVKWHSPGEAKNIVGRVCLLLFALPVRVEYCKMTFNFSHPILCESV